MFVMGFLVFFPVNVCDSNSLFTFVQQRDVQPWTMEEYMAKNARLAEWKKRVSHFFTLFSKLEQEVFRVCW